MHWARPNRCECCGPVESSRRCRCGSRGWVSSWALQEPSRLPLPRLCSGTLPERCSGWFWRSRLRGRAIGAWSVSRRGPSGLGGHLKTGHRAGAQAERVVAYSEWLRKSVQRRPMSIADGRPRQTPAPSNTIWPFWGDTEIAAPLVRVDPRAPCGPRSRATAGAGRLTRRAARLEAGCASFWGRRSGRGHGGADDRAGPRRRRCRPGACPSLPRGDST